MKRIIAINGVLLFVCMILLVTNFSLSQKNIFGKTKSGKEVTIYTDDKKGKILGLRHFNQTTNNFGFSRSELSEGTIEQLTESILKDYTPAFGIKEAKFQKKSIQKIANLWAVRYEQSYKDIPIEGTSVGYNISPGGDIPAFNVYAYTNVECPISPRINGQKAISLAQQSFGQSSQALGSPDPQLIILPVENDNDVTFYLTWKFTLNKTDKTLVFYVDAINGKVLKTINARVEENFGDQSAPRQKKKVKQANILPYHSKTTDIFSGVNSGNNSHFLFNNVDDNGRLRSPSTSCNFSSGIGGEIKGVYWPRLTTDTPLFTTFETVAINVYSGDDCSDPDIGPWFDDPEYFDSDEYGCFNVSQVMYYDEYGDELGFGPLPSCDWGTVIYLYDGLTYVVKRNNPNTDPPDYDEILLRQEFPYNGSNQYLTFDWNSTDAKILDANNVRYHTSAAWNFFANTPYNYPMPLTRAWVNEGSGVNAHAYAGLNIGFGTQSSKRWARSADVITHEFAHNVGFRINAESYIGDGTTTIQEKNAMSEGLADYFAAVKSGSPQQAPDLLTGSIARTANNTLVFPGDYDNNISHLNANHQNGRLISGPLWDLGAGQSGTVTGITHNKASELVISAMADPFHEWSYLTFLKKMYLADAAISNQSYDVNISQAFNRHGFNSIVSYFDISKGWNMISMPNNVELSNDPISNMPPHKQWSKVWPESEPQGYLWKYNAQLGGYEQVNGNDEIENGIGYFANMTDLGTFEGVDRTSKKIHYIGSEILETEVEVYNGWNLIGSISKNLDKNKISIDGSGDPIVTSDFFRYVTNQGYKPITSEQSPITNNLVPGSAYWVKVSGLPANTSGTLHLDWNATPITPPIITDDDPPANPNAPGTPILLDPLNNEQDLSTTVTFSWEEGYGATSHRFQLSTTSTFTTLVAHDSTLIVNSKIVSSLNYNQIYYWRVKAKNTSGESDWSSIWHFTTALPPPPPQTPTLLAPANFATNQNLSLYLSWNNPTGAEKYRLQVSTSSGFDSYVVNDTNVFTTSRLVSSLSYNTTYFWRVSAVNSAGVSSWSTAWRFTTKTEPPPDPCQTYSTYSQMDELIVTDANGNSQTLYMRNKGRGLGRNMRVNEEMPPEPLPGSFHARFKSGKFLESVKAGQGRKVLPLEIKGAKYPVTISWKIKDKNQTNYWLKTPSTGRGRRGRRLMLGDGMEIVQKPKKQDDVILIEALASAPPPCEEQSSIFSEENDEIERNAEIKPKEFILEQNHPNPFNPTTVIRYTLPEESFVTLKVHDVLGRDVSVLVNEIQSAGSKQVTFYTEDLPGGVYFYKLQAGNFVAVKKMLLLK